MKTLYTILFLTLSCSTGFAMQPRYAWYNPVRYCTFLFKQDHQAHEQVRSNIYQVYRPLLTLIQVNNHNSFPKNVKSPTYNEDSAAGLRDYKKTKDELDSFVRTVIRDQECMLGGPDNELEAEPSKAYTAYYRARVRNIYEEWGMSHPEYFAEALAATMGYSRPKSWYESLQKRAAIVSNKSVAKTQERLRTEFKEWQKARDKTRPAGQKSTDIQQWLDAAPVRMDAERSAAALTALALLFAPVDSSPSPLQPTTTLVLSTSPAPIREVQQVNDKEVEYKKMQAWVRTNFYDSLIALSQDKKKNAERLELALIVLEASRPFTGIYDTENQQEAEAIASVEGHFYGHLGRAKERCGNDQLRAVLEALQATVNENYVE